MPARLDRNKFRRRLLAWFHRKKRDLPWRRTRDPYRIWISEVMLQQTRVAAVLPYYRRFIKRFPTVRALARARTEEVLRTWSGLGYYSRARNLQRAAKEIVSQHDGQFPRTMEEALELPGIGPYTAAAVLSMAYAEPLAVLDGNVARVLARLGAVRGELRGTGRWQKLQTRAQELMGPRGDAGEWRGKPAATREEQRDSFRQGRNLRSSRQDSSGLRMTAWSDEAAATRAAGDWNQAMMELGATICAPRSPQCGACPVLRWCGAYRLGLVNTIPAVRKKRTPVRVKIAAAVLLDPRGRTLLVRRNDGLDAALFSGLWQFPALQVRANGLHELPQRLQERFGWANDRKRTVKALPGVRHNVTFREVTLLPLLLRVRKLPRLAQSRAVLLSKLDSLPISNATRKIAERCLIGSHTA